MKSPPRGSSTTRCVGRPLTVSLPIFRLPTSPNTVFRRFRRLAKAPALTRRRSHDPLSAQASSEINPRKKAATNSKKTRCAEADPRRAEAPPSRGWPSTAPRSPTKPNCSSTAPGFCSPTVRASASRSRGDRPLRVLPHQHDAQPPSRLAPGKRS